MPEHYFIVDFWVIRRLNRIAKKKYHTCNFNCLHLKPVGTILYTLWVIEVKPLTLLHAELSASKNGDSMNVIIKANFKLLLCLPAI